MRKNDPKAFTIIELLVVISIIAVLVAIMLPSLHKSRETVWSMKCSSSLRAIGVADETYRIDYKRWFVRDSDFVPLLAEYTGTLPQNYRWQGYNDFRKYAGAHPFKCPMMYRGSKFDGGYGEGVGSITGGGVSDYSLNTALHFNAPSNNQYITRRRDTQLVHTPSEVLNYADARNGTRLDYSTFSAQFRHFEGASINLLYVDGHVSPVQNPGITLNRGGNNTTWNPIRPYWWW